MRGPADEAAARVFIERGECAVLLDEKLHHQTLELAVLGHHAESRGDPLGDAPAQRLAHEARLAARSGFRAEEQVRELAASGTDEAREADHLARPNLKGDVANHTAVGQPLRLERHGRIFGDFERRLLLGKAAAHHGEDEPVDLRLGHFARMHPLTVAQHGDAIGNLEDLVKPVRDVDDSQSLLLQASDDAEEHLDFALGQRSGGFVHHQDARGARERLCDFDHLLLGDAERFDRGARVHGYPELFQDFPGARVHLAGRDEARPAQGFVAQENVLGHRELLDEVQLLVDDGHAHRQRFVGVGDPVVAPLEADRSRIAPMDAGEDLDERGLARSVFSDEGVRLAGHDFEVNFRERLDARKGLGYPLHRQQRRHQLTACARVGGR